MNCEVFDRSEQTMKNRRRSFWAEETEALETEDTWYVKGQKGCRVTTGEAEKHREGNDKVRVE